MLHVGLDCWMGWLNDRIVLGVFTADGPYSNRVRDV